MWKAWQWWWRLGSCYCHYIVHSESTFSKTTQTNCRQNPTWDSQVNWSPHSPKRDVANWPWHEMVLRGPELHWLYRNDPRLSENPKKFGGTGSIFDQQHNIMTFNLSFSVLFVRSNMVLKLFWKIWFFHPRWHYQCLSSSWWRLSRFSFPTFTNWSTIARNTKELWFSDSASCSLEEHVGLGSLPSSPSSWPRPTSSSFPSSPGNGASEAEVPFQNASSCP